MPSLVESRHGSGAAIQVYENGWKTIRRFLKKYNFDAVNGGDSLPPEHHASLLNFLSVHYGDVMPNGGINCPTQVSALLQTLNYCIFDTSQIEKKIGSRKLVLLSKSIDQNLKLARPSK